MIRRPKKLTSEKAVRWYALGLACAWTLVSIISLIWNFSEQNEQIEELAVMAARINFEKDVLYRRWGAVHGGVYVPVTEAVQPNPYLSHLPERDIETPSGRRLTLINPALMLRQVLEFSKDNSVIRGHISSPDPINPANAPDSWEGEALGTFEKGVKEYSRIVDIDGKPYLRFMRPFVTEKSCLRCHETQGYREGDVRGGVSVSIPMAPLWEVRNRYLFNIWFSHALIWLIGLTGIALGWRWISRSLAEQKEAEAKLARSEETFRTLSNSAPVGIFLNDAEGKCLYTNPRWQAIVGFTLEESLGERWAKAIHPDDREMVVSRWGECVENAGEYFGEFRVAKPGGEMLWIRARAAPLLSDSGELRGYVGTISDVTAQKAAQEALIEARKTEAIVMLAAGVAHDFNNLLGIVMGNINLAQTCLDKESRAAVPLAEAAKAVAYAGRLTKQFIAFSVGEELTRISTCLKDLVPGAVNLALDGSHIERLYLFPEELWNVEMDRGQIQQAFLNVIVNAREAMPEGGTLTVEATNMKVSSARALQNVFVREGRYVKISIRDNGVGIPQENLEKIFDPYFSTKTTYNQKGLGMSLANTRAVIARHEGYVAVESQVNAGTVFHIYLPASIPEESPESK